MLPESAWPNTIGRIAAKELALFFASPIAYVFLASFAAVTLFVFFWVEAFFARNIADVRPLFEWLPVLLIFLSSALTMRLWSEEKRSGTLEYVCTQPVALWHFVAGKFLACVVLLGLALSITLPLPVTVALLGDLDWGPVIAGYLATFLLGATYLSIGLWVSARSDNQIVSMITASAVCGGLYLVGTPLVTDLVGNRSGDLLRLLGSGSRFTAITRGVIDARDLCYYITLAAVFLLLNRHALESERWAATGSAGRRHWRVLITLAIANLLLLNVWLAPFGKLRLDVSAGEQYSISATTRETLTQLQEPLLLRGYFSNKTHPLLAPLVPQLRDLLAEYAAAAPGQVRVELVDPARDPELEEEANQKYGIQPVPFQVADRYQSAIVSSYFNIVVQYGDEYQTLDFNDLIDIRARTETDVDVVLRNPEYDLTRTIRSTVKSYQAAGNLFDTVRGDIAFIGYVSADAQLPAPLVEYLDVVKAELERVAAESGGRLLVSFVDPTALDGALAQQIAADYGFKPMTTSLLSDERFYFYLTLQQGGTVVQLPLEERTAESFARNLDAGIKRFASGFTKTVALVAPELNPQASQFGLGGSRYTVLESFLANDMNVERENLADGQVSGNADILLLLAPENLGTAELFAIDQFLMRGGTVVLATSPFKASFENRSMALVPQTSGLEDWLAEQGVTLPAQLVMDPVNAAFPIPVARNVGGFQVQELRLLDYPYFPDIREPGLNVAHPITANLRQATLAWPTPLSITADSASGRTVTELLRTSPGSWLSASTDILPKAEVDGRSGFAAAEERAAQPVAAIVSGRFDSYFADRPVPDIALAADAGTSTPIVVPRSTGTARLIVFSSNDFLRDQVLQLLGAAGGTDYENTLQLLANTIDWALEDPALLTIRSRNYFNRTLPPLDAGQQQFWEYLNYALAIFLLGMMAVLQRGVARGRQRRYAAMLAPTGDAR
jgi:ABC-2 type transport system permease protein